MRQNSARESVGGQIQRREYIGKVPGFSSCIIGSTPHLQRQAPEKKDYERCKEGAVIDRHKGGVGTDQDDIKNRLGLFQSVSSLRPFHRARISLG